MIEVRGLTCRFGTTCAVDRMSFGVGPGEIFGFIGPNGAGKTTTIRVLATLQLPTSGVARIHGWDVTAEPERVRDVMGYMPDQWGVYPDITVAEYLEFFAAVRDPPAGRLRAVADVMDLTDLLPLQRKLVDQLSKGMRQRLCLAKTLIHDPRLLLLDEPADGLDPRARIELRELLRELATMGKTILISSHILTELSDLVTSVGIVERGRMAVTGQVSDVLAQLGPSADAGATGRRYRLRTAPAHLEQARELLLADPTIGRVALSGEQELSFVLPDEPAAAALVRSLSGAGVDVYGLSEVRVDLEAAFMAMTEGQVQ